MNTEKKAQLNMMLSQLTSLAEWMEDLRGQEAERSAALPKRSPERKSIEELCDGLEDAMDSLEDAIRSLEEFVSQ